MAESQNHFILSAVSGIGWGAFGIYSGIDPEISVLAAVVFTISGILPNVDEGKGSTAQELAGLLAAISPLILLVMFPVLREGPARIALVVIISYVLTRAAISSSLQKYFTHRGSMHSIPAAIIVAESVYLLFPSLTKEQRIFLSAAALLGFLSHLMVDAYGNVDLMGKPGASRKAPVLKLGAGTGGRTIAMYCFMCLLGYFVVKDVYPHIRINPGLQM